MDKQIFWISSYPKSGNTLLRSILSALFFTKNGSFSLEKLKNIAQFDLTALIEKNKLLFKDDYYKLGDTGIFYKYMEKLQSRKSLSLKEDFFFLKTHSGLFEIGGNPFTTEKVSRGIIYILRDPRDICISYSRHMNISLNESIDFMINDYASAHWVESKIKGDIFMFHNRPKSFYSSWDKHVLSWTSIDWKVPKMILRYEDLVYDKKVVIKKIISFFEKNYKFRFKNIDEKIKNILKSTEFTKLKKEELSAGFIEATENNRFFAVGKKNQWKSKLNNTQVEKIEDKLGEVMKKFKYI